VKEPLRPVFFCWYTTKSISSVVRLFFAMCILEKNTAENVFVVCNLEGTDSLCLVLEDTRKRCPVSPSRARRCSFRETPETEKKRAHKMARFGAKNDIFQKVCIREKWARVVQIRTDSSGFGGRRWRILQIPGEPAMAAHVWNALCWRLFYHCAWIHRPQP
jgi:hypothetical protein